MHEFSRFIQSQCDLRGWRPSELAARSGLSRQHVSKLLNDKRSHIGQMPDDKTIEGLAKAFEGVSVNTVRDAAARALGAVEETDRQTELDLQHVSIDALLTEIRRRVQANGEEEQEPRTQEGSTEYGRTGGSSGQPGAPNTRAANGGADKVTPFRRRNQGSRPDHEMPGAASERVKETTESPDFEPG